MLPNDPYYDQEHPYAKIVFVNNIMSCVSNRLIKHANISDSYLAAGHFIVNTANQYHKFKTLDEMGIKLLDEADQLDTTMLVQGDSVKRSAKKVPNMVIKNQIIGK